MLMLMVLTTAKPAISLSLSHYPASQACEVVEKGTSEQ
jgi:hypothetical protein